MDSRAAILLGIAISAITDALTGSDDLRVFRMIKFRASWLWIVAVLSAIWIVNAMNR